eukprot:GEMP01034146.1.p1 GENE.GEMP01034146.1~~GEMP01034146.1.p1  ORF type:complete len:328 (+),score=48.37 GEMP01034146.1:171-1154(+)
MRLHLTIGLYLCTALLLFIFLLRGRQKSAQIPISSYHIEGLHIRKYFFNLLLVALLLRVASLFLDITLRRNVSHELSQKWSSVRTVHPADWRQWFDYVVLTLPSLVFMTAFSVVLFFFIHIYFASRFRQQPMLRPVCIFVNVLCYAVYVTICVLTYLLQSWAKFRPYAYFFIGVVHVLEASCTLFFGSLMIMVLHDRAAEASSLSSGGRLPGNLVLRTALVTFALSFTPLVFGVHEVLYGLDLAMPTYGELQRNSSLVLQYCLSELLPTIICLFGLAKEKIMWWNNQEEGELFHWTPPSDVGVSWYEELPEDPECGDREEIRRNIAK